MVLSAGPMPAHATSRDIIELQTQVQQLLDMVQRLQSTLDSHFGALQSLAQQTADNAKQMTATVNALQQKIDAQNEATNGKLDTVSGQVQSLNDSVDELKSHIVRLDKAVQDLQSQLQNIQTPPPNAPPGAPGLTTPVTPDTGTAPGMAPGAATGAVPGAAPNTGAVPAAAAMDQAPPLKDTYQAALRDFNAARYSVAAGEFQDVAHYYPLDDLAGSAEFYMGEIAYRKKDYAEAINYYNAVLEGFSGSPRAPAAQLHKGFALLHEDKKEAGIHELRVLIQRHPQTPEAAQARSKLNSMGVRVSAR